MLKIAVTIISIVGLTGLAQANEDGAGSLVLSITGVANDKVSEVEENKEENEMNFGAGVFVEAGINDNFGIETGVLAVNRQYEAEAAGARLVQEVSRLHVPVMARFWATDYLSVAAGPFLAFKTGDSKTSLDIGDTEIGSIETSADDDVEYGLDAALTLNFAVNDKSGVFVEGRYSKILDDAEDENADQVSALAGVKIDL
tara:strand:+ start:25779 stop:26378 length:600 start_codon:yes stop_codon:yes gene_type:complete